MVELRVDRIESVYEAVASSPPDTWDDTLGQLCGTDANLKNEVQRLLEERRGAERFLAKLAAQAGIISQPLEQALHAGGTRVEAYRLIRQIGRGGMGVVYLAERADEHFAKQVALKMLPLGLVTAEAKRRFQAEREILARLEHPHIARLLDGGVTAEGTPYYAMEYVEGATLTEHVRQHDLSVLQRLALFEQACQAVTYAHRNLVVHRDIKPGNILVNPEGIPKLLDFGIAKLMEDGREATATAMGERRLTPGYAAPELLRGEAATTGCDVYALGVVLYELLADRLPFESELTGDPGWRERVATAKPPFPSAVAADPALARRLRGDLDHIVLMAMHRDPARRYVTVEALVGDLKRHRDQLPVQARPDSSRYRAGRFLQRHALAAAFATAVFLALGALTGAALWQAHERELAARRAVATKDFLVELFQAANPDETLGKEVTVRDLYNRGVERLRTELNDTPAVKAELLLVMGYAARAMGDYTKSLSLASDSLNLRRQVFGEDSVEAADALHLQGVGLLDTGELEQARAALRRAAVLHRRHQGSHSAAYSLDLRRLAKVETRAGRSEEASALLVNALDSLPDTDDTAGTERGIILSQLAMEKARQGELDEAEQLFQRAIETLSENAGPGHHETLVTKFEYASLLIRQKQLEQAERTLHEVLAGFKAIYGPDHPQFIATRNSFAVVLVLQEKYAAAEVEFRKLLAYWRGTKNPRQASALITQANLAVVLEKQGKLGEAKALYLDALAGTKQASGERHPSVAAIQVHLADIALADGDLEQAADLAENAYAIRKEAFGEENLAVAISLHQLGKIVNARGDSKAAGDYLSQAYQMRLELLGAEHPDTVASLEALESLKRPPSTSAGILSQD